MFTVTPHTISHSYVEGNEYADQINISGIKDAEYMISLSIQPSPQNIGVRYEKLITLPNTHTWEIRTEGLSGIYPDTYTMRVSIYEVVTS